MEDKEKEFYSEYQKLYPNACMRGFSHYTKSKMKKTFNNCKPSICNNKDLLSSDNVYMTENVIKEQCKCIKKAVCLEIIRLLKQ